MSLQLLDKSNFFGSKYFEKQSIENRKENNNFILWLSFEFLICFLVSFWNDFLERIAIY